MAGLRRPSPGRITRARILASLLSLCIYTTVYVWFSSYYYSDNTKLSSGYHSFPIDDLGKRRDTASLSPAVEATANHTLLCTNNPYKEALSESLAVIADRSEAWLADVTKHRKKATNNRFGQWPTNSEHERFFAFEEMATCRKQKISCVGGGCRNDESKMICGLDELTRPCIVYSVGGNNRWRFEEDLLLKTSCQVHTFDCTGPRERFHKPQNDRLFFHHVCLGTKVAPAPENCIGREVCGEMWTLGKMQQKLGHKQIDLLKMDIEGFEWPIFEHWLELDAPGNKEAENGHNPLPMQILVEVHYKTMFQDLFDIYNVTDPGWGRGRYFRNTIDIVNLHEHLLKMGYVISTRDDNRRCGHCTELTLMRVRCTPPNNVPLPSNNEQRHNRANRMDTREQQPMKVNFPSPAGPATGALLHNELSNAKATDIFDSSAHGRTESRREHAVPAASFLLYGATSGWANQLVSLEHAFYLAFATNRTLVLPPALGHYDANQWSYQKNTVFQVYRKLLSRRRHRLSEILNVSHWPITTIDFEDFDLLEIFHGTKQEWTNVQLSKPSKQIDGKEHSNKARYENANLFNCENTKFTLHASKHGIIETKPSCHDHIGLNKQNPKTYVYRDVSTSLQPFSDYKIWTFNFIYPTSLFDISSFHSFHSFQIVYTDIIINAVRSLRHQLFQNNPYASVHIRGGDALFARTNWTARFPLLAKTIKQQVLEFDTSKRKVHYGLLVITDIAGVQNRSQKNKVYQIWQRHEIELVHFFAERNITLSVASSANYSQDTVSQMSKQVHSKEMGVYLDQLLAVCGDSFVGSHTDLFIGSANERSTFQQRIQQMRQQHTNPC